MSLENDKIPAAKCALLALLPRPKKGGDQMRTTEASRGNAIGGPINKIDVDAQTASKKLPTSVTALKPRQSTGRRHSSRNDILNDDDDFDLKLAEKLGRIEDDEKDDDSSGTEEGPARPASVPKPVVQHQTLVAQITHSRSLGIDYGDSDDSSDNELNAMEPDDILANQQQKDFFGLSAPPSEKRQKMDEQEAEPQLFIDDVPPGPSRPVNPTVDIVETNQQMRRNNLQVRAISDEEAHRLIYEKELAPFGANPLIAHDAVSQLVDVSVDTALGPNVRENLLKNLSGKQMAQLPLGPLPKMKKSDSDKLAKRKHQITHLAAVAVSREEQLQEKWADSKQTKRMSRQKYGF